MAFWEIFTGSGQRVKWQEVEAVLNGKRLAIFTSFSLLFLSFPFISGPNGKV